MQLALAGSQATTLAVPVVSDCVIMGRGVLQTANADESVRAMLQRWGSTRHPAYRPSRPCSLIYNVPDAMGPCIASASSIGEVCLNSIAMNGYASRDEPLGFLAAARRKSVAAALKRGLPVPVFSSSRGACRLQDWPRVCVQG